MANTNPSLGEILDQRRSVFVKQIAEEFANSLDSRVWEWANKEKSNQYDNDSLGQYGPFSYVGFLLVSLAPIYMGISGFDITQWNFCYWQPKVLLIFYGILLAIFYIFVCAEVSPR